LFLIVEKIFFQLFFFFTTKTLANKAVTVAWPQTGDGRDSYVVYTYAGTAPGLFLKKKMKKEDLNIILNFFPSEKKKYLYSWLQNNCMWN